MAGGKSGTDVPLEPRAPTFAALGNADNYGLWRSQGQKGARPAQEAGPTLVRCAPELVEAGSPRRVVRPTQGVTRLVDASHALTEDVVEFYLDLLPPFALHGVAHGLVVDLYDLRHLVVKLLI